MTDNTNISVVDKGVIENIQSKHQSHGLPTVYVCRGLLVWCYDFLNYTHHPYALGAAVSPEVSGSDHGHYAILGIVGYNIHMQTHSSQEFNCKVKACDYTGQNKHQLSDHMRIKWKIFLMNNSITYTSP